MNNQTLDKTRLGIGFGIGFGCTWRPIFCFGSSQGLILKLVLVLVLKFILKV